MRPQTKEKCKTLMLKKMPTTTTTKTTNQARHPVKSTFLSIPEFHSQNMNRSGLKIVFSVDSNFRGTLENFWTQGVHQSESIQTGCVSMLAPCGLWAASNCVVFVSQTLVFVLASCTVEAFVLSLLSPHCLCSRPLCPNSNGEKGTHFRML